MSEQKMKGAEAAWLSLDAPDNLMTVTAALHLGGSPGLDVLAGAVERRLCARFSRLRQRARRRPPRWEEDPDFRVERHVRSHPGGAGAEALIGDASSRPLPLTRPPWRIELVEDAGLLIASFHRCLVDTHAALRLLLLLADEAPDVAAAVRPEAAGLGALSPLLSVSPEPQSALRGPLGPAKRAARSAPLPTERVERAARALNLDTSAVLLAAVTGALRGFLEARGGSPEELGLAVDMDGHPPGAEPGARTGLRRIGLPVGCAEPAEQLAALRRQGLERGAGPPAVLDLSLLSDRGWLPRVADSLALRFVGSRSAATLVDLLAPARPLKIGGVPLQGIGVFPPRLSGQSLGMALVRYGGGISLSVVSDADRIPEPAEITEGFIAAFEALPNPEPRGGEGAASGTPRVAPSGEASDGPTPGGAAGGPRGEPRRPVDRCAAMTKAGRPCRNRPLEASPYCRVHAGAGDEPGRCAATTKAGERCKNRALAGAVYCGRHRVR